MLKIVTQKKTPDSKLLCILKETVGLYIVYGINKNVSE